MGTQWLGILCPTTKSHRPQNMQIIPITIFWGLLWSAWQWTILRDTYKDNRTCQWASVVNASDILQCARAQDCIGFHWLSVSENLCLIDGVEKVVGWSQLRWNRESPDLYPYYNPPPFHLLSTHLTNPCLKMGQCLDIEEFDWNFNSLLGICKVRIDIHRWVD